MTTISWKQGYMAADTQMTIGNCSMQTEKIYGIPGLGVIGIAGAGSIMSRVLEWWANGCEGDPPTLTEEERNRDLTCGALLATSEGVFILEDGIYPSVVKQDYVAIGSGSDFAMAAMAMGKSAEEAIREAMRHDIYTGGSVDVIECAQFFEAEKKPKYKKKDVKRSKKK